jgi:methionine-rich copper-binding protein CopC
MFRPLRAIRRRHALGPVGIGLMGLIALVAVALARPAPSPAHGIVIDSTPKHQETVAVPPKQLVIRFNSRLEKRLCAVTLVGPQQDSVLLVRQETDAPPDTLIYPLPALKPGPYRAKWKVLAADGHVTEGVILFTVGAAASAR